MNRLVLDEDAWAFHTLAHFLRGQQNLPAMIRL